MIAYILLGISLIFIILCNRHVRKFRAFFSPFYYACRFRLIIKLYKIRYWLLLLCLALVIIQQFQYVPVSFSNKQHTTSPFTEYGFIFPKSDSTYLTDSDITVLHNKITDHSSYDFKTLLSFARNEIYARHGHNFKSPVFSPTIHNTNGIYHNPYILLTGLNSTNTKSSILNLYKIMKIRHSFQFYDKTFKTIHV